MQSRNKLKKLIRERLNGNDEKAFLTPIDQEKFKVIFAIITHKPKVKKSANLPLFSRISLMRNFKALKLMSVAVGFGFVEDQSVRKAANKKSKHQGTKRRSKKTRIE